MSPYASVRSRSSRVLLMEWQGRVVPVRVRRSVVPVRVERPAVRAVVRVAAEQHRTPKKDGPTSQHISLFASSLSGCYKDQRCRPQINAGEASASPAPPLRGILGRAGPRSTSTSSTQRCSRTRRTARSTRRCPRGRRAA